MSTLIETPSLFNRIFLNPIAVRELRVACRGFKLPLILTSYLLVQGAIFSIWISTQYDTQSGTYADPTSIGKGLFITMAIVLVCVVMLVFPAFSSTAIAAEHERKSFDLLMLTPLTPWEIALGKFIAASVQASTFFVATIPLFAMVNVFGGIDPSVFFMTLWILVLLSLLISFIGVYASSLVTKAIPAVLVTYMFAIMLGVILIVGSLIILWAASMPVLRASFPIISMFVEPTVSEGAFYAIAFGVTASLYCSYFFLSTTNRLKPLSHNKSTSMRIYWTVAMIVMPTLFGAYFLATRLLLPGAAVGTLLTSVIYINVALLVPALTFPAEAAIPSRRVRNEIEKLPKSLMSAGGIMFMPGGARGAMHTAFLVLLASALMLLVGAVCYGELRSKLDDPLVAAQRANELVSQASPTIAGASTTTPAPFPAPAPTPKAPTNMRILLGATSDREIVERYLGHEQLGYLYLILVLGATVLAVSQITWRISLSGLSKSLSGVLAGLIIGAWVVVPMIVEGIMSRNVRDEERTVAQFSPVWAGMNAWYAGKAAAHKSITPAGSGDYLRHEQRSRGFDTRLLTYLITTAAIGGGLLVFNIVSHRKVMNMVAKATQQAQQTPYAYSQQPAAPASAAYTAAPAAVAPLAAAPVAATPLQPPVATPPATPEQPPAAPPAS
jgi:ABC-type transport system involved in multi-copper enzyme maturation permease subunit